jgi:diguanylate cyclase (GGDEF)-like protein
MKASLSNKALLQFINPLYGETGEVKAEFDEWYNQYKTVQIRSVTILTALLYVVYSQINQGFAPVTIHPFMTLLHLYVLPSSLLLIALLTLWKKLHLLTNILLAVAPVGAAIGSIVIIAEINEFAIFLPELYLIVIWTFSISGLRLVYAAFSASIIFILGAGAGFLLSFSSDVFLLHLLWLFSAFSFGVLNAYLIEKSHILTFLKKRQLERIATTDGLTGLNNRLKIEKLINEEVDRAIRYKRRFSLVLLDLDHFKNVNDQFGHHVGDAVLKEFSTVLLSAVRKVDDVARWGGEEFVILLPETSVDEAHNVSEHVRSKVENHLFAIIKNLTVSIGISEYISGDNLQSIIHRADKALYEAKANGRNQIKSL